MSAVVALCRAHWRHHWRSLAGLAVLVGLASAAALMPLAGARRSASVVDRRLTAMDAHDATLQVPDEGDEGIDHQLLAQVAALPEVAAISRQGIYFVSPEGSDAIQGADTLTSGTHLDAGSRQVQPLLAQGRLPVEDRVDEVALSVGVADTMGVGVGDLARLQSLSPRQLEAVFTGDEVGPPDGPTITFRVTGILRPDPSEVRIDIALTPAFAAVNGPDIAHFDNLFRVWLRDGEADLESFVASVTDLYGGLDDLFVASTIEGIKSTRAPVRAQAVGLALIALILGAAGLVASGQAVRRHVATTSESRGSLLALGLTRPERALMATGSVLPALAGVLILGPALAVAASGLLPFGLARDVEPAPGLRIDPILLPAATGLVLILSVALVAAAWTQVRSGEDRSRSLSPSRLVSLGPSATVGLTFALHGERGSRTVPVRSTIAATLVSSMLIVGAIGFSASLNRFVTTPARQGWNWDLAISPGDEADDDTARAAAEKAKSDPDVAAIAVLRATSVRAGNRDTSAYGIHQVAGSTAFTIVSGRGPVAPDEVVAGAETLRRLGSRLGATVSPEGPDGPVEMRVVGIAALPPIDNPSLAVGFGMTAEGLSQLVHSGGFPEVVVTARSGADREALADRLAESISSLQDSPTPGEVTSLDQVRALPVLLAVSLGLVGAAAVTHAVVSALRRRRRDLAILKALGFSRRQVAATVRWQANTLVAAGLVLGIPLGLVAGRWSWSILARAVGVAEDPLIPLASVALVVPAALLLATLVATPAGRLAARTRAAVILRQE